jgi:hypothetical protein
MDGFHFDHLTRLVGSRLTRRTGLGLLAAFGAIGRTSSAGIAGKKHKGNGKKKDKITICHEGQTLTVKKKGWQGVYPNATQGACPGDQGGPRGSSDVCAGCLDTCFATAKAPNTPPPGYGCCPADKICQGAGGLPDQCCDADEFCDPRLAFHVDGGGTVCCRPCLNSFTGTGCCPPGFFCNADNSCEALGTARLPRTRRP